VEDLDPMLVLMYSTSVLLTIGGLIVFTVIHFRSTRATLERERDQDQLGPPRLEPGWYSDPARSHGLRYHDGARWTANVSDHGRVSTEAVEQLDL
jgi:hypothetical protein